MQQICLHCGTAFNGREGRRFCSQECYREDKTENLIGKKFGNLKVIKKLSDGIWECECICGNHINRKGEYLRKGGNQSCGCLAKGGIRLSGTKFYHKYVSMKNRCEDPKTDSYPLYGGRGIKCERKTFEDFYKDMYGSYRFHREIHGDEDTTLDRIDNNGNYCKENCRRATRKEQANNKRGNRRLTYKGETDSIENRAKKLGLTYTTLYQRLYKGMPFEFIVEHPEIKDIRICNEMLGKFGVEN